MTDRRRADIRDQARRAAAAGIDLFQVREPDLEAADLFALVGDVVRTTRGTATRVIVNDRLDVALAAGADGVHLRGDSISAADARLLAPHGFTIGRSVHRLEEALESERHVDYLTAGTVFRTGSKPEVSRLLGPDGLAVIAAAVRVPVLAIGGVALERIGEIAESGAAGIAAIGLFTGCEVLDAVAREARARFDSAKPSS